MIAQNLVLSKSVPAELVKRYLGREPRPAGFSNLLTALACVLIILLSAGDAESGDEAAAGALAAVASYDGLGAYGHRWATQDG